MSDTDPNPKTGQQALWIHTKDGIEQGSATVRPSLRSKRLRVRASACVGGMRRSLLMAERLEERTVLSATWPVTFSGSESIRWGYTEPLADGGAFVSGSFKGTANFGDRSIASAGPSDAPSTDVFIAKLNPDASLAWVIRIGGQGQDEGGEIRALNDGSAVVTGCFSGTVSFGNTSLTSVGDQDIFVAKITQSGQIVWATRVGSAVRGCGHGLAVRPDGAIVVAGELDYRIFVATLTSDGNFLWQKSISGSSFGRSYAVTALIDGTCVMAGGYGGVVNFDSYQLTSLGGSDLFVARISNNGAFLWARSAGGIGSEEGLSIATFPDNTIRLGGGGRGQMTFGDLTIGSDSVYQGFVAKLDITGAWVWVTPVVSGVFGIATMTAGSALISGSFANSTSIGQTNLQSAGASDIYVASIDGNGVFRWATRAGGPGSDSGFRVRAFADGSALVGGTFSGDATFGSEVRQSLGLNGVYYAKITAEGLWGVIPNQPRALIGTAGNHSVSLNWTAPSSNGGASLTDYVIQYSSDSGANWTTFSDGTSTATSATVTGLTNGVSYILRVAAVNSVGTGAYLASSVAVTPTNEVVLEIGAGQTALDAMVRTGMTRLIKRGLGALILDKSNSHAGGTVVEAGEVIVRNLSALGTGTLEVRAGAKVTLDVGSANWNNGTNYVSLSGLVLDPAGRLEIGTGQIRVAAGTYDLTAIRSALSSGRNGGQWNGASGLTSASAALGTSRAIGYRVMPTTDELRLGFAAFGDATLDGQVAFSDISLINNGGKFGQGKASGAGWADGDFNYSGDVTFSDINLLNNAGVYGKGSYLPPAPLSLATNSADTGTISAELWAAYALATESKTVTKKR